MLLVVIFEHDHLFRRTIHTKLLGSGNKGNNEEQQSKKGHAKGQPSEQRIYARQFEQATNQYGCAKEQWKQAAEQQARNGWIVDPRTVEKVPKKIDCME